jgi:hypothetical protein
MRIRVSLSENFGRLYGDAVKSGQRAVTQAMRGAAAEMKAKWRAQVVGAGLGQRLGNTIRSEAYPQGAESLNAAAMVWTRAPKIIGAHQAGPTIRSTTGVWLAIPTEAAGQGRSGARITPNAWQASRGVRLRFVPIRGGRTALLVADDARINKGGQARRKGGKRRRDGILTGAQSVVIFTLIRQVKLPKRLDLARDAEAVAASIPSRIVNGWED